MSKKLKILIIRYSSIGDILLTTPVIRCLKNQQKAEIHFITKKCYSQLLEENPYLSKLYFIETVNIDELKRNSYDYIIDLHNNLRSNIFSFKLSKKTIRYNKSNFKKMLLIIFGINLLDKKHVVERYMDTLKKINTKNDEIGLEYFLPNNYKTPISFKKEYIVWAIGASYFNKQLPIERIVEVSEKIKYPIILLGGKSDFQRANKIIELSNNKNIINYCHSNDFHDSAKLIKESKIVFTNDTGMMHVASAFKKPIISFWGCTKPFQGFSPYCNENSLELIVSSKSKKPCSKHGKFCKYNKKCINYITSNEIIKAYQKLIFKK